MPPIRDFDAEIDQTPRDKPVQFRLFKRTWEGVDDVNGKRLLDNAALLDSDSVKDQRDGVIAVFADVLDSSPHDPEDDESPSDLDEFLDILNDPKTKIPLSLLVEVVGYLVEQYTERPTAQPENSPRGHGSRGRTSTGRQSGKASNSTRSVRAVT